MLTVSLALRLVYKKPGSELPIDAADTGFGRNGYHCPVFGGWSTWASSSSFAADARLESGGHSEIMELGEGAKHTIFFFVEAGMTLSSATKRQKHFSQSMAAGCSRKLRRPDCDFLLGTSASFKPDQRCGRRISTAQWRRRIVRIPTGN